MKLVRQARLDLLEEQEDEAILAELVRPGLQEQPVDVVIPDVRDKPVILDIPEPSVTPE